MNTFDEISVRFPHLFENIFNMLDNNSLTNGRKVSKAWQIVIDREKITWLRMIQKYGGAMEEFRNHWKKVIEKTTPAKIKRLYKAVEQFFELRSNDQGQYSPLHVAAGNGQFYLSQYIIRRTGNFNPMCRDGFTALHNAAEWGQLAVCELIVENSADKNPRNQNGYTPLHYAAITGEFEVCRLILNNVDAKNPATNDGLTPLHCAAIGGHLEVLRLLFETGVDMRPLYNEMTPLQYAAENFQWKSCRFLMEGNWRNVAPCLMAAYNRGPNCTFFLVILLGSMLVKLCHGILTLLLSYCLT